MYRILIVEDEKEINDAIEIYLKSQGYEVLKAFNGKQGINIIQNNEIHLAIIDIMMPIMDGIEMTLKIRNKYDFEAMGYDEHQTKYICYTLGHDGKEPNFMFNGEPVKIDVNMDEVREKIESGKYNTSFIPTAKNYDMLLRLCRADALAQSEIAMQNGKQVGTRKEKVENIENIQSACEEAFHSVSEKVGEYSNEFIEKILLLAARKVDSRKQSEKAQALLKEFEKTEYAARLKATGVILSYICPLMYMNNPLCKSMPVMTSSNKLRTYTTARYYTEAEILERITKGV